MSFYQTVDMLNCIAKHTFNHLHDVFSIKVTFFLVTHLFMDKNAMRNTQK